MIHELYPGVSLEWQYINRGNDCKVVYPFHNAIRVEDKTPERSSFVHGTRDYGIVLGEMLCSLQFVICWPRNRKTERDNDQCVSKELRVVHGEFCVFDYNAKDSNFRVI